MHHISVIGGAVIECSHRPVPKTEASAIGNKDMTIGVAHLQPIVSLIAGILILIMPQLLNYIVAIFLIISGILGLGLIH
jgi:Protein of unknown function (DUF3096)